jgi:hypothetical protein
VKDRNFLVLRMLTVAFVVLLAWPGLASAQSLPRLRRLPPHKDAAAVAAVAAAAAKSTPTSLPSWQLLRTQPPVLNYALCGPGNPLLLTDGTVMLADNGCHDWWKLTPDEFGNYVNGTWTELAPTPAGYSPLYHSSAVLPDGRVIIEGGEYNLDVSFMGVWTNLGAIYDPIANTWTPVNPPEGWTTIGDAQSVVLFDGTYMQANCCTNQAALLDPKTLTWTSTGAGKFDPNDEEGWTLLPNKQVLTVDAYVPIPPFPYEPTGMNSELYNPGTGVWTSAGSTVVQLWDSAANCGGENFASFEVGPAVLRPDGTVFATGANSCGAGHTAVYNSNTGTWTAGPDFPDTQNIADGPATLLPSGNVLVDTSAYDQVFPPDGAHFFEWDGTNLNPVPPSPNAANDDSSYGNFLVLPTGQILFADFFFVSVYTPAGTYDPAWAPRIQSAPDKVTRGGSYVISGYLFNGMSQGAAFGDDTQAATNYPLVRVTKRGTGHVSYWRTHDHSSMAVGFNGLVSTHFDVPADQELGASDLVVVANGIPSQPIKVVVNP